MSKIRNILDDASSDDEPVRKRAKSTPGAKNGPHGLLKNLYTHPAVQKFIKKVNNPSFERTRIALNSRTLIVGGSGAGKTHLLTHYLLESPDTFQHVVLCNRGIEEPLYAVFKDRLEKKGQMSTFTLDSLPDANVLSAAREDKDDQYLVILDDIITDLDNKKLRAKINTYFTVGRKLGLTVIFLSQSYYQIPKTCRVNMTYLMLLKLSSDRDLKMILSDFTLGVDKDQLIDMYQMATEHKMNCLKIDVECTEPAEKFSRNFLDFFDVREGEDANGTMTTVVRPGKWYIPIDRREHAQREEQQETGKKKGRGRSIFTRH